MENTYFNKTAIIGGGAAGFFAAANLAEVLPNMQFDIYESARKILEKVRVSGGGRCNVTHIPMENKKLINFYPRGMKELLGPFTRFKCEDTIAWFEARGVKLKIEADGRVFPVSNNSETIIECLSACLQMSNVNLINTQKITEIHQNDHSQYILKSKDKINEKYDFVIIATGNHPSGFQILRGLNIPITELIPSLFTFHISENWPKELMGLSVNNVKIKIGNLKLISEGSLLFTHWGLSGPAVLKMSSFAAKEFHQCNYNTTIQINWLPELSELEILQILEKVIVQNPKKIAKNITVFDLPSRLWLSLLINNGIENKVIGEFSKKDKNKIVLSIMHTVLTIVGKSTYKDEFVTCGGVKLNSIDLRTFESKQFPNLFIIGEVLNIDGLTGGFNFQAAWTGAWHAAQTIIERSNPTY